MSAAQMSAADGLHACLDGAVLTLALDRPAARNALDARLCAALTATLRGLPPAVRAVVLRGRAAPFCAGADLREMAAAGAGDVAANVAHAAALGEMFAALDAAPVVVVARVEGCAYGGGVGLLACCDVVVAADDATFCLSEARLGLAPAVIAPYVRERVGAGEARRLMLTAAPLDAAAAQALHLVHLRVPAAELDAEVARQLALVRCVGPGAVAAIKALLRDARPAHDPAAMAARAACLAALRAGAEGQEGVRAQRERRPPAWAR